MGKCFGMSGLERRVRSREGFRGLTGFWAGLEWVVGVLSLK